MLVYGFGGMLHMLPWVLSSLDLIIFAAFFLKPHSLTMAVGILCVLNVLCGILVIKESLNMLYLTYGNLIPCWLQFSPWNLWCFLCSTSKLGCWNSYPATNINPQSSHLYYAPLADNLEPRTIYPEPWTLDPKPLIRLIDVIYCPTRNLFHL